METSLSPASLTNQSTPAPQTQALASWLLTDPTGWEQGALLAIVGTFGALASIWLSQGKILSGAAQVRLDRERNRLRVWEDYTDELRGSNQESTAAGNEANQIRDDLHRAEEVARRQFVLASLVYIVLGAGVAALFAQSIAGAATIGAGWTGLIGMFGLKADYESRVQDKDEVLGAADRLLETLEHQPPIAKVAGAASIPMTSIRSLRAKLTAARKL